MARTESSQRPAPGIDLSGRKPVSAGPMLVLATAVLAVLWAVAMLTDVGRLGYTYAFYFVDFFGGVFALVGLSLTVMIGLLATDRLVLQPRQRVWIQSAHRTLGIVSVICLVFHILTKVSEGRISATGAAIPFLGGVGFGQSVLYVGLGPVAGYLMTAVLWTGLVRRRFVGIGRPWMWRALHSTAYLSWPIALLHGLGAGRPPATWVTLSYLACVLAVAIALLLRLSMGKNRRGQGGRLATTTMSTGSVAMRPVGKLAPAVARRIAEEVEEEERGGRELEPAYADTMFAAARLDRPERAPARELERVGRAARPGPARAPRPAARVMDEPPVIDSTWRDLEEDEPAPPVERVTRRRVVDEVEEYDEPRAPRRRLVDEDEPVVPRRRAIEEAPRAARRVFDEDEEPRPRRRPVDEDEPRAVRRRALDEDDEPRSRRRVAGDEEDPRPRRRALEDDEQPRAGRRRALDEDDEPRAGRRRALEDDEQPRAGRRRALDEDDEPRAGRRRALQDDEVAAPRGRTLEDDEQPRAGRRRAAAGEAPVDRRRTVEDTDGYERADDYVTPPPPRRPRSADEYLVTGPPRRDEREELYAAGSAAYGPPPERASRAGRAAGRLELDEPVVAAPEPRYRATAPAPPYIPSPALPADDLILDDDLVPPDDTPTLVDLASRRAIRDAVRDRDDAPLEREAAREAATKARRARRRKTKDGDKDDFDEEYWGFLRGEAQ